MYMSLYAYVSQAIHDMTEPKLTTTWGAGFSFSKCHAERAVPYDPYLNQVQSIVSILTIVPFTLDILYFKYSTVLYCIVHDCFNSRALPREGSIHLTKVLQLSTCSIYIYIYILFFRGT